MIVQFKTLAKLCFISIAALSFSACQSINHGSLEKRSAVLSQGMQQAYQLNSNTANRLAPLIIQGAEQQQVSPSLLTAIIRQESTFRSNVVSPAGAVGLTQVMPRFWQQQCPGNLYDEYLNINCGAMILSQYHRSAGSWKKALAYYNVGPSGYNNQRKMRKQGKKYAKSVLKHEKELKKAL